jgi:competence protein ComEA
VKKIIKDYFSFNKTERRGLFVLLSIIVLLIIVNICLPYIIPRKLYDFSAFQKEIDIFEKQKIDLANESQKDKSNWKDFDYSHPEQSVEVSKLNPFPFDPNTMVQADWKRLGLTDRQIKTIMNYKAKGGTYQSKQDFKKMYCISPQEYEVLSSYIQLPETAEKNNGFAGQNEKPKKDELALSIEINKASADDFMKIKGIGEYFANKIISYRSSLGGFCRKEQLLEVSKMDSVRYFQILPFITINSNAIRKLDVNSATFEELSKHPYIGYNIALSLTNYRNTHGKFKLLSDIKKSALITEVVYQKISPYLRLE